MRHVWQTPEGRWSPTDAAAARRAELLERADVRATAAAAHPLRVVAQVALLNAAAVAAGVGLGVLAGDPPIMLREAMPVTWLSVVELAAIALVAWSVHRRAGGRRWHDDFFGLAAIVFAVLAVTRRRRRPSTSATSSRASGSRRRAPSATSTRCCSCCSSGPSGWSC